MELTNIKFLEQRQAHSKCLIPFRGVHLVYLHHCSVITSILKAANLSVCS